MLAAFRVPRRLPLHQRLVVGLLAFQVVLVLAYVIYASVDSSSANRGADFFDLDQEGNLPSWFSSAQLLAIAIVMWGIAFLQRADDRPSRISLVLLGAFFIFFSIDESLVIHERIKRYVGGGGDYRVWMVVYGVMALLAVGAFRRDLASAWHLYRRPTSLMIIALGLLLLGGVGLEIVDVEVTDTRPEETFLNKFAIIIEEWLEMLGATVALYAAMLLAQAKFRLTRLRQPNMT